MQKGNYGISRKNIYCVVLGLPFKSVWRCFLSPCLWCTRLTSATLLIFETFFFLSVTISENSASSTLFRLLQDIVNNYDKSSTFFWPLSVVPGFGSDLQPQAHVFTASPRAFFSKSRFIWYFCYDFYFRAAAKLLDVNKNSYTYNIFVSCLRLFWCSWRNVFVMSSNDASRKLTFLTYAILLNHLKVERFQDVTGGILGPKWSCPTMGTAGFLKRLAKTKQVTHSTQ